LPSSDVKPTTLENYRIIIRKHLIPTLGHHQLDALTAADVQRMVNAKRASGLSPRTVQLIHAVLRRALGQAVKWGEARRNVAGLIDSPRVPRREAECLTPEHAQRLLEASRNDRLFALYAVALACGLRRGEALALQWTDVDLDAGHLRVARTLSRVRGALVLTEPKSARSRRTVPLPRPCVETLRAHRVRQAESVLSRGRCGRTTVWCFHPVSGPCWTRATPCVVCRRSATQRGSAKSRFTPCATRARHSCK